MLREFVEKLENGILGRRPAARYPAEAAAWTP
jgi:hypothetical protein